MLPHLSFFSSPFPYLSFPLRINPLHFRAKRRLNLALVFVFILCCSAFLLIGECELFRVSFSFFCIASQEIGFGKRVRNDLFCVKLDVKTTTQSISQF